MPPQALAAALQCHIVVYSTTMAPHELGEEHKGAPGRGGAGLSRAQRSRARKGRHACRQPHASAQLTAAPHRPPAGTGRTLRLCYLRHAYGLGEHYESVVPGLAVAADGSGDEEGEAAAAADGGAAADGEA